MPPDQPKEDYFNVECSVQRETENAQSFVGKTGRTGKIGSRSRRSEDNINPLALELDI